MDYSESIPFAAPVEEWKKKKGWGPVALLTVVLLGMAYLAGTSYHSNTNQAKMMTHSDKVDGMVTNLQGYDHVTITNQTPYTPDRPYNLVVVYNGGGLCNNDFIFYPDLAGKDTSWTASSRGICLVKSIQSYIGGSGYQNVVRLQKDDGSVLICKEYSSSGTSYSKFFIIMDGDRCCVKSSHEVQNCN